MCYAKPDSHIVGVNSAELSRLLEAEALLKRRIALARNNDLSAERRAIEAGQLRLDELAYGCRYS